MKVLTLAAVALSCMLLSGVAHSQVGTSRSDPLVTNTLVDFDEQGRLGLVAIRSGPIECSGTLIRNDWVLTAAHCLENAAGAEADPASVEVSVATEYGPSRSIGLYVKRFRPTDLALVQLDRPLRVHGSTFTHFRSLDTTGVYPSDIGKPIVIYGRGVNKFSYTDSEGIHPAERDRQYRRGDTSVASVQYGIYTLKSGSGVASGDSGGSTMRTNAPEEIIGVHSTCVLDYTSTSKDWMYLSGSSNCKDVSVNPFVRAINDLIQSREIPNATPETVTTDARGVLHTHPTILAENGTFQHLDLCLRFGEQCNGEDAANAFCLAYDSTRPIASSFKKARGIGPTAVIQDRRICRDRDSCDGFAYVRCGRPLRDTHGTREQ